MNMITLLSCTIEAVSKLKNRHPRFVSGSIFGLFSKVLDADPESIRNSMTLLRQLNHSTT